MGRWWRERAEGRRRLLIATGLLWAFGALPGAVVLLNLNREWAWAAAGLALAPFIIAATIVIVFLLASPLLAREPLHRAIGLAAGCSALFLAELPTAAAGYGVLVVIAWGLLAIFEQRKPTGINRDL